MSRHKPRCNISCIAGPLHILKLASNRLSCQAGDFAVINAKSYNSSPEEGMGGGS